MCGFLGYFSQNKRISLEKAIEEIHHRGPDETKILYEQNWGVAFKRLSIIDLSSDGMQPFCESTASLALLSSQGKQVHPHKYPFC